MGATAKIGPTSTTISLCNRNPLIISIARFSQLAAQKYYETVPAEHPKNAPLPVNGTLATPQQETSMTRPRPVFRARSGFPPPGFGCARLATPHPGGGKPDGRKTNYRKQIPPAKRRLRFRH